LNRKKRGGGLTSKEESRKKPESWGDDLRGKGGKRDEPAAKEGNPQKNSQEDRDVWEKRKLFEGRWKNVPPQGSAMLGT